MLPPFESATVAMYCCTPAVGSRMIEPSLDPMVTVEDGGDVTLIATVSFTMIGSSIVGIATVDGGGGNVMLMLEPISGIDCVKLEPDAVLVTLLSAALSVNVIVAPLGAGPDSVIVTVQAPPEGSVVGKELAPFEQVMGPRVKAEDDIAALVSASPVEPTPIFDTVTTRAAVASEATVPKPTLLGEKNTTGAATLISCVIVT